ncbi:hypothetical protein B0H17DRAFT_1140180 [Mycena rosella]|uniref:Uncharacterized protein n=1 Tax=Mycena rosella TaxID=1033263 RepID=A0AAD7D6E4_MYCRO|nr:hypothetical protein B0H17DRAFT_1140180 [Mycena rosella]
MAKRKGRKNTKKNEAGPSREDMPSRKHQDKMIIDGDPPPMSSPLIVAVGEISSLSSLTQLPSSSGQQEQAVPNGSARSGRSTSSTTSSTTSSRVPATQPSILKKLPKPTVEDESDNKHVETESLSANTHQSQGPRANLRATAEALARERGEDETSVEFNKCKAALARSENRLRDIRVNEDHEYAQEVAAAAIAEEEDRADASRLKLEARQRRQLSASSDQNSQSTPITPTRSETPCASESPVSCSNAVTNIGEVTPPRSERSTHKFYDRVVLQRYRSAALANDGECSIPDQGIAWDKHGKLYECAPAPSCGSSIGTRGGKKKPGRTKDAHNDQDRGPETSTETLGNPTAESTQIEQRPRSESQRQGTRSNANDQTPTSRTTKQHRSSSGFYAKGGTPPVVEHDGGSPLGSSSSSESSELSSKPSDSSKLEEEDKSSSSAEESDSDSDYETDRSFGNSESTNSAWDEDPQQTTEDVLSKLSGSSRLSKKTRARKQFRARSEGPPSEDSNSSSNEEKRRSASSNKPKRNIKFETPGWKHIPSGKGPSKTSRKYPQESEQNKEHRDRKVVMGEEG